MSLSSLSQSLVSFLVNSVVALLVTTSVAFFLLSIASFIYKRSKQVEGNILNEAKNQIFYSSISLFVIFSIWGIISFSQSIFKTNTAQIALPSSSLTAKDLAKAKTSTREGYIDHYVPYVETEEKSLTPITTTDDKDDEGGLTPVDPSDPERVENRTPSSTPPVTTPPNPNPLPGTPPVVGPVTTPAVIPRIIPIPTTVGSNASDPSNNISLTCASIDGSSGSQYLANGNLNIRRNPQGEIQKFPCGADYSPFGNGNRIVDVSTIPDPSWDLGLRVWSMTDSTLDRQYPWNYAAGKGALINAYNIDPSICRGKTSPVITKLFYHNLGVLENKSTAHTQMKANNVMIYGVKTGNTDVRGSISFGDTESFGTNAVQFMTVSEDMCDFDTEKVFDEVTQIKISNGADYAKEKRNACYYSDGQNQGVKYYVSGALPAINRNNPNNAGLCILKKNTQYYINVRFKDASLIAQDVKSRNYDPSKISKDSCEDQTGAIDKPCSHIFTIRGQYNY